jgi:glutamate-1-semialdehyde 2,1-aminomutase
MHHSTSQKLFLEAQKHIPGGVDSPVRAFKSVGGTPPFIVRAKGAYIYDADDNTYIDYVGSWGPAILGHAAPEILNELNQVMKAGLSFGAPTPKEIELAQKVKAAYPSVDKIRFVSSGTEATMSAIRVARGFTGKDKIIKFDGCYHGHADTLLVKAGSGAETCGVPDSLGVPASFTQHTVVADFNDADSVEKLASKNTDIAAIIVEPVIGNMGCIPPQKSFLTRLRDICDAHKIVLIFDEVMTGFRVAFGGAQEIYGVKPDMTCFGKIIGGGLPVGAYGGRQDIMDCVAPLGGVYQAGTLSGNPLAMAVGCKTLDLLKDPKKYEQLEKMGTILEMGLRGAAQQNKTPLQINRVGSMFSFFFTDKPIIDGKSARAVNKENFIKVFHHALENGIYLAPSAFEAGFISLSHTEDDIHKTVDVLARGMEKS